MREIPLTRGYVAMVDDEDYERVSNIHWHAVIHRKKVYAQRPLYKQTGPASLHRFILDAPKGFEVDHIDGNSLNCTRKNMRLCDHYGNSQNRATSTLSKSGFKGVYWDKGRRKWKAEIQAYKRTYKLGRYALVEDAARAYDAKARELHGQFARLNFPNDAQPSVVRAPAPRTKLTADAVKHIRSRYALGSISLARLASEYNVYPSTIHDAVTEKTWRAI